MPKAYVIVDMDVTDPDRYAAGYVPLAGPAVEAAGGRFLAPQFDDSPEAAPTDSRSV